MGSTPVQCGLAGDLGKCRRAADGGNDLEDPQSPLKGLIGLIQIYAVVHSFHRLKHSKDNYLTKWDMSSKKLISV